MLVGNIKVVSVVNTRLNTAIFIIFIISNTLISNVVFIIRIGSQIRKDRQISREGKLHSSGISRHVNFTEKERLGSINLLIRESASQLISALLIRP